VPTPAVSKRRSVTQTTPWPPDSQNLKTRSIRHCTLYTNRSGKVGARTRTNGQDQPNRHPTQPQQLRSKTQKPRRASGSTIQEACTNKKKRTGKENQTDTQLNHSSSGQRPKSHGEQAGDSPGGRAQTRTNEHAKQPKQRPSSTTAAQVKDPKATESTRETIQEAEHGQERTNKQGNPNRSPTQPQQLRSKTQKPRRASGNQSRQERTRSPLIASSGGGTKYQGKGVKAW
jgi:hypothetical protein